MRDAWVPESSGKYANYLQLLHKERLSNKQKIKAFAHRRVALSKAEREAIRLKTDSRCHICGGQVLNNWQADHVLSRSGGGIHSVDNYLPAHRLCNNYRWDYLPEEFQEILKLGVWLRTQIEKETKVGCVAAGKFLQNEKGRVNRRV